MRIEIIEKQKDGSRVKCTATIAPKMFSICVDLEYQAWIDKCEKGKRKFIRVNNEMLSESEIYLMKTTLDDLHKIMTPDLNKILNKQ